MQTMRENPYSRANAIAEASKFHGQTHTLRRLYSDILNGESVSLVGPRRSGKTSILRCMALPEVLAQFEYDFSRHIMPFVDIRICLQKTRKDFFETVSKGIVSAAKRKGLNTLDLLGEGEDGFTHLLEQVKEQGYHVVLLLDAFDNITKNKQFDLSFFGFLRALASARLICYVTASITFLSEIVRFSELKSSPFFNFMGRCEIRPLTPDEARSLALLPSLETDCPFTEVEVERVLKLAGRHPFFIQRICYFLYEEKSQSPAFQANWDRIKKQAYEDLSEHFPYMWVDLNVEQQTALKDEAQRAGAPPLKMPLLGESALFRKYVRDISQLSLFRMTKEEMIEELKELLKHLNDLEFLGKSEIRHLKVISMRFKNGSASTTMEKGRAIQQILNEAFEQLKGSGIRRDSAPEWKSYNILYYRYFKHHLKQEQIDARLESTSRRQYYREWNQALGDLLNILLEMEEAISKQDVD